jgi:lipopolysaccharide export system permease protein
MVFKRIDRYVTVSFLVRFLGIVCLIAALYTSYDLLKRLEEIREVGLARGLATLGQYYARLLPVFLLDIVPGIVLVAAGMVMVQMARARELLALKACGTSLYRVMAPIFFWTLLISIAVFALRETFGPRLVRQVEALSHILDNDVENQLLISDAAHNRKVFIGQYDFSRRTMKNVSVLDFYADGVLRRNMQADGAALTTAGVLRLRTVEVQEFDASGSPAGRPTVLRQMDVDVNLTPMALVELSEENAQKGVRLQTLPELLTQMRRNPDIPFFRVSFHSRLASFFGPLILLLVGLPFLVGFERSVNSRFLGIIVSIGFAGALYALTFIFTSMGGTGALNPVLAGWLPAIITGALGLWLFQTMMT